MNAYPEPAAFVDTNILVYAIANDDVERSPVAQALIKRLMTANVFHVSTQVLQELFVTLTQKGRRRLTAEEALRYFDQITAYPVVTLDFHGVRAAAELSSRDRVSFWDALIVIAASRARASRIYTEDMQHGRTILGMEIVNPFRNPPGAHQFPKGTS